MCPLFLLNNFTLQQSPCRTVAFLRSDLLLDSENSTITTTCPSSRLYQKCLINQRKYWQSIPSNNIVVSFFTDKSDSVCLAGCDVSTMSFVDEQRGATAKSSLTRSRNQSDTGPDCSVGGEDRFVLNRTRLDRIRSCNSTVSRNLSFVMVPRSHKGAKTRGSMMNRKYGHRPARAAVVGQAVTINANSANNDIDSAAEINFDWSDYKSLEHPVKSCRVITSVSNSSRRHTANQSKARTRNTGNSRFYPFDDSDRLCDGLRQCTILTDQSMSSVCANSNDAECSNSLSVIAGVVDNSVGTCNPQLQSTNLLPYEQDFEGTAGNSSGLRHSRSAYERAWTLNKLNKPRQLDRDGYRLRASCVCVRGANEDEVLLITSSRDKSRWVIPGGGIEPGESAMLAAERETAEEAGVGGTIDRLLGTFENEESAHRTIVYVLKVERELLDWEEKEMGRDRRWFSLADARTLLLQSKPAQLCYLDALELSNKSRRLSQQDSLN